MSQESVIAELQRLGMSGYEAKAYVALIAAGTPLNGYEVAKRSGVPRSTVYETLGKLVSRGAAYEVRAGEASVGYISLPPSALLDRMRREFDASIDTLRDALPAVASPPQVRLVHNLTDRASLLARAEDVVAAARNDLFLSGWPAEIEPLKPVVRRAEAEGVDVSVVSFGEDDDPVGSTTPHRFSTPEVVLENLGCRLLVVSADREQAVIGGVVNGDAWGVYTDDPAVVLVAVEYVRHDIAMHLIAQRFAPDDFESFWTSDPDLRRLRADHGIPAALLKRGPAGASAPPRRSRRSSS
ncbi:TrmB family transcriptional regulator [Pseudonocardia sp. KRD-184]|uniref:TrmB family transcriptional regulator n=1 Tax=Pseudonocardia oceani TaxID=2792013 RepID=A0ABS6U1V0_9PSEU|nr:helix-turn-helix domain-containing protein [Pseudonocardia oceani]MBW0089404.1 TrmB family transcriptional regulator [Pseudonocardia oceani]MBW0096410.1 TrmB family transcriptional regulator [Pseudonocardia oceani]MBW0109140.1 TrmB family transcriptional regulator [Pseudonocardia oceani]MBW0122411.1 TrmB family transcriptional regulator [Pseudonocardia oceani]MBW0126210.1 TrmB family transcriptional regulator [Pseudonocardia oceani]